jgi:TPR repeat protein
MKMRCFIAMALTLMLRAIPVQAGPDAGDSCTAGTDDKALAACRQAVAERPDHLPLLRQFARALIDNGQFDEAAGIQARIVRLAPRDWAANYAYAGTLGFIRRYDEALSPILRALESRPKHVPTLQTAALIYTHIGRNAEARAFTERAAALGSIVAMYDMVRYYTQGLDVRKSDAEAFRWTRRAAENGHVFAMWRMVEIYLEGEFGQAPDDAEAEAWAARHRAAAAVRR